MSSSLQSPRTNQGEIGFFYLKSNVLWSIIQQSFTLRIFLFYAFSFEMHMPTKKYQRKKAKKLCIMGQIVIESHSCLKY